MTHSLFPHESRLGLVTDLYELTMAAGYFAHGLSAQRATFELWVRRLPAARNFLVVAGLEQAIDYLVHFSFAAEQVDYLRRHPTFAHVPPAWFDQLTHLRFDGDLWAIPEGTVVFPGEPLLRVSAPLMVAQILETYLLTTLTYQTLVATKAARSTMSARDRAVVDFGSRRAHGPQAGLLAARAAFLGGCAGTSNTEAARLLDIPAVGTQAHAWVMAHDDEREAFRRFGETFPGATLLVDTYDTVQGVRNALASGAPFSAVRLDSGDLVALSRAVRAELDAAGRRDVKIAASGDLNEFKIRDLLAAGAAIDVFGVGTELVTSHDQPSLSSVYKLVEQDTPAGPVGRLKLSAGKRSYPFAKQVFRTTGADGHFQGDLVARATEQHSGQPLLAPVLRGGQLSNVLPTLHDSRQHCLSQLAALPAAYQSLDAQPPYPVAVSPPLQAEEARMAAAMQPRP